MAQPQFNALTGPELIDVILSKVREKLEDTGEFKAHRTFPWVKLFFGSIKVLAYPKQDYDDEPEIKTDEIEVVLTPDAPQPDEQPVTVEIAPSEEIIDTPDQARMDADLPLPTPGLADAAGVTVPHLVDKLVQPPMKRGPGRPR